MHFRGSQVGNSTQKSVCCDVRGDEHSRRAVARSRNNPNNLDWTSLPSGDQMLSHFCGVVGRTAKRAEGGIASTVHFYLHLSVMEAET
jgi:hypothetical protein